jgi:hypothetical protein
MMPCPPTHEASLESCTEANIMTMLPTIETYDILNLGSNTGPEDKLDPFSGSFLRASALTDGCFFFILLAAFRAT